MTHDSLNEGLFSHYRPVVRGRGAAVVPPGPAGVAAAAAVAAVAASAVVVPKTSKTV